MAMANTTSEKGYCTTRISRFEMYCAYESAWAVSNPVPCSISMIIVSMNITPSIMVVWDGWIMIAPSGSRLQLIPPCDGTRCSQASKLPPSWPTAGRSRSLLHPLQTGGPHQSAVCVGMSRATSLQPSGYLSAPNSPA